MTLEDLSIEGLCNFIEDSTDELLDATAGDEEYYNKLLNVHLASGILRTRLTKEGD